TGLLLPVRTDDAMRARLATLLALGANRLADAAAALRIPGPHGRAGMLDGITGSAQALRDLAAAEELENGLLRRPRGQPARRQAAIDRLVRILLYVDQLLPILSASPMTAESLDLLGDMAAAAQDTSHRVGAGTAPGGFATLRARSAAQKTALVAGFTSGTIAATHFEAERRLLETMDGLLDVLETLEATMAASRKAR
ncbi:MAG: hypothetical protein ABI224_13545, partial [Acetobacteraceae bacterium]